MEISETRRQEQKMKWGEKDEQRGVRDVMEIEWTWDGKRDSREGAGVKLSRSLSDC